MLDFIRRLFLLVILIGLLLVMYPVQAQIEPSLSITKIDQQNFPDVRVYLRGDNLGANLSELVPWLTEDGKEAANLSSKIEEVGIQTAFLLDASGSVLEPGLTGEPRHLEVGNVTSRLVDLGELSAKDWLAAYAPDANGNVSTIQAWTRDHRAVANKLYTYQPPTDNNLETPLNDLIFFALDRFDQPDVPENIAKKIVLFSDGITGSSDLRLDDAVDRAIEEKVPIHTVLLGPETEEGRRNMNRIAKLSGGQAYQITTVEALDELWNLLAQDGEQFVLSYRSQLAPPRELSASVNLPNSVPLRTNKPFPPVNLEPVQINIIPPPIDGFPTISKNAPVYETPLEELEPKIMNIQVEFSWPDGFSRNLKHVEYMIGNKTEVRSEAPFDQIFFPIERLNQGDYTLRVTAIDELDIKSESSPLSFRVNLTRPPAPTPPLIIMVMAMGVVIVILLFLVIIILSKLQGKPVQKIVDDMRRTLKGFVQVKPKIKATLIVTDPGEASTLSYPINIYVDQTIKFGGSPHLADIVIDDPYVSGLHCRITEDAESKLLRLYDEGSTTGTSVNFDPVPIDGQVLNPGDLINVGPVQFRIHYPSDNNGRKRPKDPNKPNGGTEQRQPIASS